MKMSSRRVATCVFMGLIGSAAWGSLPPVPTPPENPITEAKRILGKILFWDEQLSSDNTVSCATCHMPEAGGVDPRRARHPGFDQIFNNADDVFGSPGLLKTDSADIYDKDGIFGLLPQVTGRNANSAINAAFAPELFWDGRADSEFVDPETGQVLIASGGALESQAVGPPVSSVEMAHADRNWTQITMKLRGSRPLAAATSIPQDMSNAISTHGSYPALFAAAFGDDQISAARIAFAIATYERTLIADDTPWDRRQAGILNAMTPQQIQGQQVFQNSRCAVCHTQPFFTDQSFRNIGLRPPAEDLGRQVVTQAANNADRGKFRVPSLRNVGLRGSFMHNGQMQSLNTVVAFYARAPGAPPQFPDNRDPIMPLVFVPPQAVPALVDFLQNALTDARVANAQPPFDHPTLWANRPADRVQLLGNGVAGQGGVVPTMIGATPAYIGNIDFKIGLDLARPSAQARLFASSSGPVNGRIPRDMLVGQVTTEGVGIGNGFGTVMWPIEAESVVDGQIVFAQWVITDPAAVGGEALSPVARIRYFCGGTGCAALCAADWNGVDGLDSQDFFDFYESFFAGEADFNGDGGTDSQDLFEFLEAFFAGCS